MNHRRFLKLKDQRDGRAHRVSEGQGSLRNRMGTGRPLGPSDPEYVAFTHGIGSRAVAEDVAEDRLVRAVAEVEGLALVADTPWHEAFASADVERRLSIASRIIEEDSEGDAVLFTLSRYNRRRFRDAVETLIRTSPWPDNGWAGALEQAVRDDPIEFRPRRDHRSDRVASMVPRPDGREMIASALVGLEAEMPAMERSLGHAEDGDVELLAPGYYEFSLPRQGKGRWLRVVDRTSQVLIALAPVQTVTNRSFARVVLPTELALTDITHEVIARPPTGRRSSIDLMLDAVRIGRRAARGSARGSSRARDEWLRCAALWTELGDTARAHRAVQYAAGRNGPTRPAYIHDQVRRRIA